MSTYLHAEQAILDLVRASADGGTFTEANSSRNDWTVVDGADLAAVVTMAGDSTEADRIDGYGVEGFYQERHLIAINVTIKIGTGEQGPQVIAGTLNSAVEALKDELRLFTRLGGVPGVRQARIVRTGAPGRLDTGTHYMQPIVIQVDCESELPEEEL